MKYCDYWNLLVIVKMVKYMVCMSVFDLDKNEFLLNILEVIIDLL